MLLTCCGFIDLVGGLAGCIVLLGWWLFPWFIVGSGVLVVLMCAGLTG